MLTWLMYQTCLFSNFPCLDSIQRDLRFGMRFPLFVTEMQYLRPLVVETVVYTARSVLCE